MLNVTPIRAFADNYIWCIQADGHCGAWVVDPGDGQAVLNALGQLQVPLAGILVTHHHFDHTGGIDELLKAFAVPVLGPHNPAISQLTQRLAEGDEVEVLGVRFQVMEVPGHTLDHIAFYHAGEQPLLFCGDTLFAGGCGRVFEGHPAMMAASLDSLAVLPADTLVYCAHEYTMANLSFAAAVEPDNASLQNRIADDGARREQDLPTVPSLLATELATNPFLRCGEASVLATMRQRGALEAEDPVSVFTAVRGWKDKF